MGSETIMKPNVNEIVEKWGEGYLSHAGIRAVQDICNGKPGASNILWFNTSKKAEIMHDKFLELAELLKKHKIYISPEISQKAKYKIVLKNIIPKPTEKINVPQKIKDSEPVVLKNIIPKPTEKINTPRISEVTKLRGIECISRLVGEQKAYLKANGLDVNFPDELIIALLVAENSGIKEKGERAVNYIDKQLAKNINWRAGNSGDGGASVGLFQLQRGTFNDLKKIYGKYLSTNNTKWTFNETVRSTEKGIRAVLLLLHENKQIMLKKIKGSSSELFNDNQNLLKLMAAAYNYGVNGTTRKINSYKEWETHLPRITQDHIKKVNAAIDVLYHSN